MKFSRIIVLCALLAMTACGFHLRGSIDLPEPLKKVYVMGASNLLQRELTSSLKASKGQLVEDDHEARVVIKILHEELKRRVLSLGASGKSNEFELTLNLKFQVFDTQDNAMVDEQSFDVMRDFYNDQQDILAKNNEEELIKKEMYKQAVRILMTRARVAVETYKK